MCVRLHTSNSLMRCTRISSPGKDHSRACVNSILWYVQVHLDQRSLGLELLATGGTQFYQASGKSSSSHNQMQIMQEHPHTTRLRRVAIGQAYGNPCTLHLGLLPLSFLAYLAL